MTSCIQFKQVTKISKDGKGKYYTVIGKLAGKKFLKHIKTGKKHN